MLTYLISLVILISAYAACKCIKAPLKILEDGWRLDLIEKIVSQLCALNSFNRK